MSRISHIVWAAMMSLLLATSLTLVIAAKASPSNPAPSSDASSQDKAKACNDAADKKGLTGSIARNSCRAASTRLRIPALVETSVSRTKQKPATTLQTRKA